MLMLNNSPTTTIQAEIITKSFPEIIIFVILNVVVFFKLDEECVCNNYRIDCL